MTNVTYGMSASEIGDHHRPVRSLEPCMGVPLPLHHKQGVALTGAINRLDAALRHRLACAGEAACRPATKCYRRRQTTDDNRRQRAKQYCPLHYV